MKLTRGMTLSFVLAALCGAVLPDAFSQDAVSAEQQVQQQQQQGRQGQSRRGQQGRGQQGRGQQGRGQGRQRPDPNALKVGQIAPTFELMSLDGESKFNLKDARGEKPVVLFFGSYT